MQETKRVEKNTQSRQGKIKIQQAKYKWKIQAGTWGTPGTLADVVKNSYLGDVWQKHGERGRRKLKWKMTNIK